MTAAPPAPLWHPTSNLAAVATMIADAAIELSSRLASLPDATSAQDHPSDGKHGPAPLPPDLATTWEIAASLSPAPGQLAKAFKQLGAAVAGAPHDDERLIGLAAALTEAAERLDAAADHIAMALEDPDVADRIAQLAALPSAPGHTRAGAADEASDDIDDPYCPVTGGRHRIDWPTVRLPCGHHSVLVNCAACGQTGELNLTVVC
jgi:hypothetical protein